MSGLPDDLETCFSNLQIRFADGNVVPILNIVGTSPYIQFSFSLFNYYDDISQEDMEYKWGIWTPVFYKLLLVGMTIHICEYAFLIVYRIDHETYILERLHAD